MKSQATDSQQARLTERLLAGIVLAVSRFPRTVLILALLAAGLSAWLASTRLEYRTQRSDLANPHKEYQQRWRQYLAEFGDDDDIVIVVQGNDRAAMQQALDALAEKVQQQPDRFDRLFYKVDLRPLRDRALLYLPTGQIRQIQENLQSMALLLEFGPLSWRSLTLLSLMREARHRAGQIHPEQPLSAADDQFLTQLRSISRSAADFVSDPGRYRNPWSSLLAQPPEQKDLLNEPQYFFNGNGTLAFLLVRPVKDVSSFTAARESVDRLRQVLAEVQPRFPGLEFGLTGLPVLETDEMVASQKDTQLASLLALAGVAVLYLLVYRGLRYPLFTVATLVVGTLWALGWLTLTVGHLNILSAAFAVMLIGMGDYGVLWVSRYEQDRLAGLEPGAALRNTAVSVGPGILTASLTTALAFFAAMLADFQAIAELGWIAGCGVLLCALSCFTVMPALLTLLDDRGWTPPSGILALPAVRKSSETLWLPWLAHRPHAVIAACLALTAVLAVFAGKVYYDHNLLNLQARGLDSVKWELTLTRHTAGASWHALSYTASPEEALALKARYEKLPVVSRVVEVASLVPAGQEEKLELLRDIRHRLRRLPERGAVIPHARPSSRDLKTELTCLIGQLQPLADSCSSPILAELRRSLMTLNDRLADTPRETCEARLQDFEERLAGDLAADLHRLRDVCNPAPVVVSDLPAELRERFIGKSGKWLLRVFGKDCLWDYEPLEHFTRQIQTVDAEATGKPFATLEGLRDMKNGFLWAGAYALAAIILLLLADFRSIRHTLVALAPLAMGVLLALGVMGLAGLPLNPANMIAFPLILGVGVDNGVHVLHDYLCRRHQGRYTLSYPIGRGIMLTGLTTMLGFGTLLISSHRGLAGLGFVLALGVACCMLAALVFLPALLRLLSRRSATAASTSDPAPALAARRAA
jgi:hypothetical protein